MRNIFGKGYIALAAACIGITYLMSCKKETKEDPQTTTTYYIKVVEVDQDNTTLTETPIATVKITE